MAGIVAAFNARRADNDPELSAAHEVFELATTGSGAARAVVDDVARRLGTAIAAVCAMLDPELVVLGGGIGSNPLLLSPVRGAAASLVPITARIETSLLGDRAALQGAVAVALHTARTSLLSAGGAPATRTQPVLAAPRLA
jgi:predicted NBD/HSP70 family sugar kinase